MKQRPVAVGMLLCEQIIIEEGTKCQLLHEPESGANPIGDFPFTVFAILADGLGEMLLEVVIHRLDNWEEIYRAGHSLKFADPLQNVRCNLRIRDCSFPIAGHYQVSLLVDSEMVAQRKMVILSKRGAS